ncbi:hypothetical protein [Pantoea agglomerans]|uniref:SpaN/EivJ family type III secretion system needle length determinant n=1 Tax=Enterobacter agglomerans TaxID=549 RepID=UPI0013BAA95A|nr:hypothetical protein [Pantoea agglomerans]NEG59855.1 hypothetical protein [Pantoea agglomerans]NEG98824.1 hypothetical protein [Pantoea agglomerans]NEH05192.1 hypothetical protein [Pantoea agglomerans]NEH16181.1 hypothetical protein [Pantoea agglomerans]
MAEKITETSVHVTANTASSTSSSGTDALLKHIDKKKKKNKSQDQIANPEVLALMQHYVTYSVPTGFGGTVSLQDKQHSKNIIQGSQRQETYIQQVKKAPRPATTQHTVQTSSKSAQAVSKVPVAVVNNTASYQPVVQQRSESSQRSALSSVGKQSVALQQLPSAGKQSADLQQLTSAEKQAVMLPQTLAATANAVHPATHTVAAAEQKKQELNAQAEASVQQVRLPQEATMPATSQRQPEKTASTTLTQKASRSSATAASKPAVSVAPSTDINYPFTRWAGDHSVRITLPQDARTDGNVILQPSDLRASEALSRNMPQFSGHPLELLITRKESQDNEQSKQQQQQRQEEETE